MINLTKLKMWNESFTIEYFDFNFVFEKYVLLTKSKQEMHLQQYHIPTKMYKLYLNSVGAYLNNLY